MKILRQFAVIFLLFWVSHGISTLLPFTMPASVIGLLLMFGLLLSGLLKADSIREAAEFLQGNMTLFLLPVVTSSMNYVDIIMENALGLVRINKRSLTASAKILTGVSKTEA